MDKALTRTTMISTRRGPQPARLVHAGHWVYTDEGLARVSEVVRIPHPDGGMRYTILPERGRLRLANGDLV
jgi:hypothetical protein